MEDIMTILTMLKGQFIKMSNDGSWLIGTAGGGLSLAIPEWITGKSFRIEHLVLILILLGVFVMEWLVGSRLAKQSQKTEKSSTIFIDSAIRDFIILIICGIAYGFDYLFGTGSLIFCLFTFAFIYHNFYSLMANFAVLGWEDKFPMWLIKWLQDEIKLKKEKYFPTDHHEGEKKNE